MTAKLLIAGLLLGNLTLANARPRDVASDLMTKVKPGTIAYRDENGFLYSRNELEHVASGAIMPDADSSNNPLDAIKDFHDQLEKLGITLSLVPVPPKLAIHPCAGLKPGEAGKYLQEFYRQLTDAGINVIDLMPGWLEKNDQDIFCRTDAHWSPLGIEIAADKIAGRISLRGDARYSCSTKEITIVGDLLASLDNNAEPTEKLTVRQVHEDVWSDDSPVLLLGDSHLLFFSVGGDMLADNAGLGEQLALKLQMPVERIAVRGSAANAARINLFRKAARNPAWLKNKKYIVWCFSCREFNGTAGGWRQIPVMRPSN
jgi:hypothetical protein